MGGLQSDMAWWLGLLPLLAVAIWYYNDAWHLAAFALGERRRRKDGMLSRRLPPGHMGLPFLGETLSLYWYFKHARRPDEFIEAKRRAYGDVGVYRTHMFGSPTAVVCSPAANKFVLQSADNFSASWPEPELVGFSSVINVEGSQHTRLRGFIIAATNRPRALRAIASVVQPGVVAALRSWADKGTIIAATEMKKVTFDNICKMFASLEPSPLTEKMDEWFGGVMAGLRSFPLDFPGTALHRARKCRRNLNAVFREELEKRKKRNHEEEEDGGDLMSGLMAIKDEQGNKLRDDEVVDNIVSLIVAGYESTSSTIMWAAYHLSRSPHVLAKLREENMAMRSSKEEGSMLNLDDVPKLKYTAKVVEETIRMANIASMVHRVANKDVEYKGYTIPKGWKVLVWIRSIHTDARNYVDPLVFNPDRWDETAAAGTFLVFGGGYRICAGNMLARLQLTVMLHHLSVGYEWELLNPDAEIDYLPHPRPVDGAAMAFRKLNVAAAAAPASS